MKLLNLLKYSSFPNLSTRNGINPEGAFCAILNRERAKADRNGHIFSVVTFEPGPNGAAAQLTEILKKQIRATDELVWLDRQRIGVLLFNTPSAGAWRFVENVRSLPDSPAQSCECSVYTYPAESQPGADGHHNSSSPDRTKDSSLSWQSEPIPMHLVLPAWKRLLDVVGSLAGLTLFSPLFLLIGLYIKIVSPGPVFFKQQRIGYGGKPFTFWKFRTMRVNADTTAHQKLLADLIKSSLGQGRAARPMSKLDNDQQIIPFGKLLRKSCIDELPQLINVLRGEMSMVGPRPPIYYEVKEYLPWHKGRFNALPGMTGLWQVSGKNRLTFREMICLDIRYARQQSLWLDLKILLKTPLAIATQIRDARQPGNGLILPCNKQRKTSMKRKTTAALVGICIIFAACSSPLLTPTAEFSSRTAGPKETILAPGDTIDIKFLYWPELNDTQTIRPDGKITLQLVDEVAAAGLSPAGLDQKLTELYTGKLKNPAITVVARTLASQRIFVGGEVKNPGNISLLGNMTVLDAIIAAGGFSKTSAELSQVVIVRQAGDKRLATAVDVEKILASPESEPFYLAANDVVYVPQTRIDELNQWVNQYLTKMVPDTSLYLLHRVDTNTTVGVSP